jgi:uncharacterized protein YbaR (Trm112 family)
MEIDQEFVDKMICPACGARLRLKEGGAGIKCLGCRRLYPIEDEIIVMLPDKATVEDDEAAASG